MLGQRFLPTAYQKKLYEMDYDKHTKKLQEIKKSDRKKDVKSVSSSGWKTSNEHFKHLQFVANEKVSAIDKNNQVLLDKLVEISKTTKNPLFTTNEFFVHPKTLNSPYRKKELERIASENESLAKRLISQHGSINSKQMKGEFKKHKTILKRVQKLIAPKENDRFSPIHSPKAMEASRGFRVKTIKTNKLKRSTSEGADGKIKTANEARLNETLHAEAEQQDTNESQSEDSQPSKPGQDNQEPAVDSKSLGESVPQNAVADSKEASKSKLEEPKIESKPAVTPEAGNSQEVSSQKEVKESHPQIENKEENQESSKNDLKQNEEGAPQAKEEESKTEKNEEVEASPSQNAVNVSKEEKSPVRKDLERSRNSSRKMSNNNTKRSVTDQPAAKSSRKNSIIKPSIHTAGESVNKSHFRDSASVEPQSPEKINRQNSQPVSQKQDTKRTENIAATNEQVAPETSSIEQTNENQPADPVQNS